MSLNKRFLVLVLLAGLVAIVVVYITASDLNSVAALTIKGDKKGLVFTTFLHDFFQTSKNKTVIPYDPEHLIVFQHIPRSAGDSMRTHLFNNVAYDFTPFRVGDREAPPRPWLLPSEIQDPYYTPYFKENKPKKSLPKLTAEILKNASVVKGYWSTSDIDMMEHVTGRDTIRFTFLRHPLERALSFYGFAVPESPENLQSFVTGDWLTRTNLSLAKRYRYYDVFESQAQNLMTWQLGGPSWGMGYRTELNDSEVLRRAKLALDNMDFIGFYESLHSDFLGLWWHIFPHSSVPWIYPIAFYVGTLMGFPRLRVLKYSAHVTPEQLETLRQRNLLDA